MRERGNDAGVPEWRVFALLLSETAAGRREHAQLRHGWECRGEMGSCRHARVLRPRDDGGSLGADHSLRRRPERPQPQMPWLETG